MSILREAQEDYFANMPVSKKTLTELWDEKLDHETQMQRHIDLLAFERKLDRVLRAREEYPYIAQPFPPGPDRKISN